MSAEKTQQKVSGLMKVARASRDSSSLWQIAAELERLSAWEQAREVERMAYAAAEREAQVRMEAMR